MSFKRSNAVACALATLFCFQQGVQAEDHANSEIISIEVVGTEFQVVLRDGTLLDSVALHGAELSIVDAGGHHLMIRIDDIEPDPKDPAGETLLYTFSARDPSSNVWRNFCDPDADGLRKGFPLAGYWTPTGEHIDADGAFTITCTSGASGKCVRLGYKPWRTTDEGVSLWDYHQACTRLLRADYCGNGHSYTQEGTPVLIYDLLGIQKDEPEQDMTFEGAWGPDGAICVRHVRVTSATSLEQLVKSCPGKLSSNVGANCTEENALRSKKPLILNKS